MAPAWITASTGRPKRRATSALLGVPSCRPITPSTRIRSATAAASASRARASASPVIQRSIECTGAPLAAASSVGSRKSGPVLNTRTVRPWRACSRASAAVTVVLPCPEAGAATSRVGTARPGVPAGGGVVVAGWCSGMSGRWRMTTVSYDEIDYSERLPRLWLQSFFSFSSIWPQFRPRGRTTPCSAAHSNSSRSLLTPSLCIAQFFCRLMVFTLRHSVAAISVTVRPVR
ncbi:hypothetical protein D3C87_1267050 [compost metagenome]